VPEGGVWGSGPRDERRLRRSWIATNTTTLHFLQLISSHHILGRFSYMLNDSRYHIPLHYSSDSMLTSMFVHSRLSFILLLEPSHRTRYLDLDFSMCGFSCSEFETARTINSRTFCICCRPWDAIILSNSFQEAREEREARQGCVMGSCGRWL